MERVRKGDIFALRTLLDESYRQKKDFPRAFYYLSLYHNATGRSFFEDDAKAFDEFGGLFKNAIESVSLLDKQIQELEVDKTELQEEKNDLNQVINEYTKKITEQERSITSQDEKYKELLTERDNLLSKIESLDKELNHLKSKQDEMNKMKDNLDEYAKELSAQEETIISQNEKCKVLLEERDNLLFKVTILEAELNHLKSENEQEKIDELEAEKIQLQEEINTLEQRINEYIKELSAQEETITSQNKKYKNLLAERDNLLSNVAALDEELSRMKSKQDGIDKITDSFKEEIAEYKKTIQSLENKIDVIEDMNLKLRENAKEKTRTLRIYKNEIEKMNAELVWLRKKYQGLNPTHVSTESPAVVGVSRGLLTMAMAPLNLLRAPFYAYELTQSDPYYNPNDKFSTCCETTILLAPAIVVETVPCVVDVANGLLDFITLGYYGDEIYGFENSPWWWERTNRTFPWINKD